MAPQFAEYSNLIHGVLAPLISERNTIALFDFPNHPNVGDSAIWLGEESYFRKHNLKIIAVDDCKLVRRPLPKLSNDVVILIHGGGNFGDLYPHHQNLREKIITHYREHRVIQLPQSIHFQDRDKETACRKILNDHKDFHLLARDRNSLSQAEKLHYGPSYLCPDMALCLGAQERPVAPAYDIVCLMRADKEKVTEDMTPEHAAASTWVGDWLDEPDSRVKKIVGRMDRLHAIYPRWTSSFFRLKRPFYYKLAEERLLRGTTLLSSGKVVVTDRLHAHILCALLDIPHVVLDNSYGKIGNFRDAWGTGGENCLVADSLEDAMQKAQALIAV